MIVKHKNVLVLSTFWMDGIEFLSGTSRDIETYTQSDLPKDFLKIPSFTRYKVLATKFEEAVKDGKFKLNGTVSAVEEKVVEIPIVPSTDGTVEDDIIPSIPEQSEGIIIPGTEEIVSGSEGDILNVLVEEEVLAEGELSEKEQNLLTKTMKELKEMAAEASIEVGNMKKLELVKAIVAKGTV